MLKRLFAVILIISPLLSNGQKINIDKIVAKIDNYFILKSEVESLKSQYEREGHQIDNCQALESMAIQKLLVAKAEIDSVIVENDEIKDQLDARMNQMIALYGNEKNIMEQFGKSTETLKSELRTELKEQMTAEKMKQTIFQTADITPLEVKKFFDRIPKDSIPDMPTEVQLSQIVRLAPITPQLRTELRNKLLGIKKRIQEGESFEDLAREFSEDPGSANSGGNLGWAKRGMMQPEFEAAAMQLDSGKLSDIVETTYGFHLIQTLEKRGQEYRSRHILLMPDYQILSLEEPTKYLDSLRAVIVEDSLNWYNVVRDHSEDEFTKDAGGIIIDMQTGNDWFAIDVRMDPSLYFVVNNMKLDEISQPVNYRTPDGKTGMRLIKMVKRKEKHPANLEDDYEKIKEFALNEKQNKIIEKWFKEALAEVYIKIDQEYQSCNLFNNY